jgi:hypothetical protein
MRITELFAMFGYRRQLVDLWEKQAQKRTRLKKLNNGLTLDFLKPKYLTGRRGRCATGFLAFQGSGFENGEGFQGGHCKSLDC